MKNTENTENRIEEILRMVVGARKDILNGGKDNRETADMQLSVAESWLKVLPNLIRYDLIGAKCEGHMEGIDALSNRLDTVFSQTPLETGECNLKP